MEMAEFVPGIFSRVMRGYARAAGLVLCAAAFGATAHAATYTSFDPPASTRTGARSINDKGQITGGYVDTNQICYLRYTDGSFTAFGQTDGPRCNATSISSKGLITGEVGASNSQCNNAGQFHGFVRAQDGKITTFDPQGSVDTVGLSINGQGQIVGYYLDSSCVSHGFLRTTGGSGKFRIIDPKGTAGTEARSINDTGTVTGYYLNADGARFGFLYQQSEESKRCGKGCTSIEIKGSAGTDRGSGAAINDSGTVTGSYTDSNGAYHGYLLATSGVITKLNAPGAGTGSGEGTFPQSINATGVVAGYLIDGSKGVHGFYYPTAQGKYKTFDFPGSSNGTTYVYSINGKGQITGTYVDTGGVQHGYVRSP